MKSAHGSQLTVVVSRGYLKWKQLRADREMSGFNVKFYNLARFIVFVLLVNASADENLTETFHVKQLFNKYGKDNAMTISGFESLLESIGLKRLIIDEHRGSDSESGQLELMTVQEKISQEDKQNSNNSIELRKDRHITATDVNLDQINPTAVNRCLTISELMKTFRIDTSLGSISNRQFYNLCPAIVYELDKKGECHKFVEDHHHDEVRSEMVWLYATVAIFVISLSGLIVVAMVPILRGSYYQISLQFLVALAVGSLIGDALLHLLPHALSEVDHHKCHSHGSHAHEDASCEEASHHLDKMVWKGLVGVAGIFIFFMAERLLTVFSTRRKQSSIPNSSKLLEDNLEMKKTVGEKLCKHKYNSYSYCYGEVTIDMLKGLNDSVCDESDHHNCLEKASQTEMEAKESFKTHPDDIKILNNMRPKGGEGDHFDEGDAPNNGVIIAQHEHRHHGHSHMHTHTVPASISSVAWMVIMGDGLHNFSDGLAIGAAFSNSITGGVSTSIAVFCHELPHELGDFAILLKSGMTARQALAYNGLSSLLCFIGMLVGVALGNVTSVSTWIFAGAAGMFVYIALVDMIPELNSSTNSENCQLLVQFLGMALGVSIMLLIALYEHDLQRLFNDD